MMMSVIRSLDADKEHCVAISRQLIACMDSAVRRWLMAMGLLIFGAGAAIADHKSANCAATFAAVHTEPIKVIVPRHSATFQVEAVLIGCKAQLSGLTPSDWARARTAIANAVELDLFQFRPTDASVRARLVKEVNRPLGRDAVTDIFLYNFAWSEQGISDGSLGSGHPTPQLNQR